MEEKLSQYLPGNSLKTAVPVLSVLATALPFSEIVTEGIPFCEIVSVIVMRTGNCPAAITAVKIKKVTIQ